VRAVDAAPGQPRDEVMAVRLEAAAQDKPVLALLDNHALKHVEWEPRIDDAPTAAELLVRHGVAVVSVLQACVSREVRSCGSLTTQRDGWLWLTCSHRLRLRPPQILPQQPMGW
jgi:hypothetical protein